MQGRLSAQVNGRIRISPPDSWREEFAKAAEADLYCIEWIYDEETEPANPLRTDEGISIMRELIADSGVKVVSVCADYYMTSHLVDATGTACGPLSSQQCRDAEHAEAWDRAGRGLRVRTRLLHGFYSAVPRSPDSSHRYRPHGGVEPRRVYSVLSFQALSRADYTTSSPDSSVESSALFQIVPPVKRD